MTRQNKTAVKYMLIVWAVTCALGVLVSCAPKVGADGRNGRDGTNGEGCIAIPVVDGAIISCSGNTTVLITNGTNGVSPGQYAIVEIINPCGQQGAYDEVILRTAGGQLLGHYSDGAKQFLTLLQPGNYQTTDGHACPFTVNADMTVSY